MKHLVLILFLLTCTAHATDNSTSTQTNTSGSNTTISGGYTSTTTNNNDGQTNTTTNTTTNATTHNNNTNTHQKKIPVGTATAPSMSSYSQDLCIVGVSGGVQVTGIGVSGGTYFTDRNCERMKLSKLLYDFNMRVASIAMLCQDDRVFSAMEHAGTPCPFEGKIGKDATAQWKKYDIERPDYEKYIKQLRNRATIDARLKKVLEKRVNTDYDLYGDDDLIE